MNFISTKFIEIDIREIPLRKGTKFRYTDSRMPFNGGIYEIEGYDIMAEASPPHRVWKNKLIKKNGANHGWDFRLYEADMIEHFKKGWFTVVN